MLLASLLGGTFWVVLRKLGFSALVLLIAGVARVLLHRLEDRGRVHLSVRTVWTRKFLGLGIGVIAAVLLGAIWFESGAHLATFTGLVGAGLAFASQQALLSLAAFFVITFGRVFNIGERIEMGGVRGDVVDIGLLKTTVMEMGVPEQLIPNPNHWVGARQYTGRLVTLTNSKIFDQPVFNLSRNFEFLWEELRIPLKYDVDLQLAERIVLDAVREATRDIHLRAHTELRRMRQRFLLQENANVEPHTYVHLTDNWIELAVRFVSPTHGIREIKDRLSRNVLYGFRQHGIEIASTTQEIVGFPRIKVESAETTERGQPDGEREGEPAPH